MKKMILPTVILAVFFALFTEQLDLTIILAALLVSSVIAFMNRGEIAGIKYFKIKTIPLWITYILILVKEVMTANIQVAKIALSVHMPIDPKIVSYQSRLMGDMFLTILANSITLTPGTMSVDLVGNTFLIHCLNDDYAQGLVDNHFEEMLLKIEEVQNG